MRLTTNYRNKYSFFSEGQLLLGGTPLRDVLRGVFGKHIPTFQPYGYTAVLVSVDFLNKSKKQWARKSAYFFVF